MSWSTGCEPSSAHPDIRAQAQMDIHAPPPTLQHPLASPKSESCWDTSQAVHSPVSASTALQPRRLRGAEIRHSTCWRTPCCRDKKNKYWRQSNLCGKNDRPVNILSGDALAGFFKHDEPENGASVSGFGVMAVVTLAPAPWHPEIWWLQPVMVLGGQTSWRQLNKLASAATSTTV